MPRSRKNKKGILEVGFFIELKNRHIIQLLPAPPKLLAQPRHYPSPYKTKGNKERGRRREVLRMGNVCVDREHL